MSVVIATCAFPGSLRAQADGSWGEASLGFVGGMVVGSVFGLSVATAEARLFNHYLFGTEAALPELARYASTGAFIGFGLGALDAAELRRLGTRVVVGGGIGLVAGALVGAVSGAHDGTFAGAYVGTGVGVLVGALTNFVDRPERGESTVNGSRRSIPIGVRITF
jgi:hypothetical protein